jgi:hypothetical protein
MGTEGNVERVLSTGRQLASSSLGAGDSRCTARDLLGQYGRIQRMLNNFQLVVPMANLERCDAVRLRGIENRVSMDQLAPMLIEICDLERNNMKGKGESHKPRKRCTVCIVADIVIYNRHSRHIW